MAKAGAGARRMALQLPVTDLLVREAAKGKLLELLEWLTADNWDISFVPLRPTRIAQIRLPLVSSQVCLFSGGLDSTAGWVLSLLNGDSAITAFSVATNSRLSHAQQEIV